MASLKYLNAILTVLAILLALQLWTTWTGLGRGDGPLSPESAAAQSVVRGSTPGTGGGIPDAGAQRKEMIDLLKTMNQKTDELTQLFKSGQARVRLEGGSADKPKEQN